MQPARLREDGAIELPAEVTAHQGLSPGSEFSVIEQGNLIILVPIVPMVSLRGIARGADTSSYRDRTGVDAAG